MHIHRPDETVEIDHTPVAPLSVGRQVAVAALCLVLVAAIAVGGSLASASNTEGWYLEVEKVPWNPPNEVFGPAWTVLYVLIALVGFLIWRAGYVGGGRPNAARRTLRIYAFQLVLNAAWTPIFFAGYPVFGQPAWWVAMGVILALVATVIWLMASAAKWSRVATLLLIPYLLWLLFASSLNAGIIVLNSTV
ncbi:tryptophan-rich sensory protein [Leucobacter rhizosphaerae]|uniref:Tryptophan-rich sensory protein n=1 Tax=Leucobacter rhizosphaerae TaxID=2932245 RepID=A0ABY4FYS1_9MICO|nr:TspO/MBR family protein [Leucobacter rhizosphaerae]UOQ61447.1 tryptophan-rich sensory protein [Leucobacter rhizosphaerae]